MDEAPAGPEPHLVEKPLDGAPARPGEAVAYFLLLLGRMDVDGAAPGERNGVREVLRANGSQGMRCNAEHGAWQGGDGAGRRLDEARIPVGITQEAALARTCAC